MGLPAVILQQEPQKDKKTQVAKIRLRLLRILWAGRGRAIAFCCL
jgi:hypothetical protein